MALDSFPPRLASTRCQALTPCSHPTAAAPEQAVALLAPFWSLVLFSASCLFYRLQSGDVFSFFSLATPRNLQGL